MKPHFTPFLCTLLLVNCSVLNAIAAEPATQASPTQMARPSGDLPQRPYFLTGTEIVWRAFPRKPALGSSTDQCDLLTTLSIQASRTEEQKNEAVHDKDYSIKLVTDVIDPDFETKYPMTFEVLKRADLDGYFINSILKKANGRPRPFRPAPGPSATAIHRERFQLSKRTLFGNRTAGAHSRYAFPGPERTVAHSRPPGG